MPKRSSKPVRAYRNPNFLNGPDARALRILSEYMEPDSRFAHYKIDDTIVFFGSARIPSRETAEAELAKAQATAKAKVKAKAGQGDVAAAKARLHMSQYYEATRELARRLTDWSKGLEEGERRFVVCTGGGPGIMEAANRGASEAKGVNVGLNITLPMEQSDNPYTTRELAFEFHYFFMRKFWFAYLAKALIIMPGGFGTMDELFEVLTLVQTHKIRKHMPIVLFGSSYWNDVVDFEAMAKYGTINLDDLNLFFQTDSVDEAYGYITEQLSRYALDVPGAML